MVLTKHTQRFISASGAAVPPVRGQQRGGAAERPSSLSDQQPRAAADRAAVRERPEPAGARGERRPAVLFDLHTKHTGGAAHYQHTAGGKEDVVFGVLPVSHEKHRY